MNKKRIFIGIPLDEEIQNEIERCQRGLQDAKWTKKENLHLTLIFIGDMLHSDLEILKDSLSSIEFPPFEINLKNPKVFIKKTDSIIWLPTSSDKEIIELRNRILTKIENLGLKFEKLNKERFTSHVTIARLKKLNFKKLNEYLLTYESFETNKFLIKTFAIFSSILKPEGAIYHIEKNYNLNFCF